ncbi:MAG: hypothetical protein ACAI25_16835 [Planctomycetota bacterium]
MGICKCPFCHEPLEFDRVAWVACAGCLARHHASCWTESPRCASCADPRALSLPPRPPRRARVVRLAHALGRLSASVLVAVGPAVGTALWLSSRMDKEFEKVVSRAAPAEKDDRTDEVLEALEASDSRTKKRLDAMAAEVALLRRTPSATPIVVTSTSSGGMAAAIEQIETLKNEGRLTSSQRDAAKKAVLLGRVSAEQVMDVARLGRLKESGLLSSSEFDRAKQSLLDR